MPAADLTQLFSALADPTRRAILTRLSEGDAPVKDLVQPFGLSGPAITKHLKVLERAGLISRSRAGQERPCRLEPRAFDPAAAWIEQFRAAVEDQLDRLGAYLKTVAPEAPLVAAPKAKHRKKKATPPRKGSRHGPRT